MVATAATSAFFPATSPLPTSAKTSKTRGGASENLDARGFKSKSTSSGGLQVKANAQAPHKINGTMVGLTSPAESVKIEDGAPSSSPPPRTFINLIPDWSVLLAAITTIFLAAEKQWTLIDWNDWKPRRSDMLVDPFGLGRIVQDGLVFSQNFSIRSYEIGADRTASIETLMNHLQETALNHVRSAGLMGDGFGSTPEMSRRNLIWVVTRMQVLVDRYPSWSCRIADIDVEHQLHTYDHFGFTQKELQIGGDVVQVDTWVSASGKNGMRRDWLIRDCKTGETLTRATSVWVMMNKHTRKLSKIPEEARGEIEPYFMDCAPILDEDGRKLPKLDEKTADCVQKGLTPRWNDLDINQHVNNVKYIGWILESAPPSVLESHELSGMNLEYRRECGRDSVLQSLTAASRDGTGDLSESGELEYDHLLRLETGAEIVRGRTEWRPKRAKNPCNINEIPAESA